MSVDAIVQVYFQGNDRRTIGINPPSGSNIPCNFMPFAAFANGTGASQCDVLWQSNGPRTFSGSTDVLNLYGVLTDSYGTLVNSVSVKGLGFLNLSTTNNIVIGGGTNPVATFLNSTGTLTLPPGAFMCAATPDPTGWLVTPSTACNFTVTGTPGQAYEVVFLIV